MHVFAVVLPKGRPTVRAPAAVVGVRTGPAVNKIITSLGHLVMLAVGGRRWGRIRGFLCVPVCECCEFGVG